VLEEVEQRLVGPLHVVEGTDKRMRLRFLLEQLAELPGDLLGASGQLGLSEQRPQRPRGIAFR
jgi:hypothetical protein